MALWFVLLSMLLAWVTYSYFWEKRKKKRQSIEAIPGLKPSNPKSGNLEDIGKAGHLHQFLTDLHGKFGEIAFFWMGNIKIISVSTPAYFRQQRQFFDRNTAIFEDFRPILGPRGVGLSNGKLARNLRSQIDPFFSHESCMRFLPIMTECMKSMAKKWESYPSGTRIPLRETILHAAFRALVQCCFGDYFKSEEACEKYARNSDILWKVGESRITDPSQPLPDQFYRAKQELYDQYKELIEMRKNGQIDSEGRLLIDSLIELAEDDEELLLDNLNNLYIAGFHTTASMATNLFFNIAKQPKFQDRMREEILEILGENDDIFEAGIQKLRYTKSALEEALRLCIVVPYTSRVAESEFQLGPYHIPKGTVLMHAIGVASRDSNVWTDPEEFDPDHFNPRKKRRYLACPFFGFAGGRRCPGWRFSMTEVFVMASVILRGFEIRLADADARFDPVYGLVTVPKNEIFITATPRH